MRFRNIRRSKTSSATITRERRQGRDCSRRDLQIASRRTLRELDRGYKGRRGDRDLEIAVTKTPPIPLFRSRIFAS
jgi:hypothetical protein